MASPGDAETRQLLVAAVRAVERGARTTKILARMNAELLTRDLGREAANLLALRQLHVARPSRAALTGGARPGIRVSSARPDHREERTTETGGEPAHHLASIHCLRRALGEQVEESVVGH